MKKNLLVILAAAATVALPFLLRRPADTGAWRTGDPVLVAISPHNDAIRQEFAEAFSRWHQRHYGVPVRVDWRVIGGTTEIMRFLTSEYVGAMRAWWARQGRAWPAAGAAWMLDRHFDPAIPPDLQDGKAAAESRRRELYLAFRTNDHQEVSARIDILFGGGVYDHDIAARRGLTVPPWQDETQAPTDTLTGLDGHMLIPRGHSGEIWRSKHFFGTVLSTFGICYNPDRLRDLGLESPPQRWTDLAHPAYFGHVGITDPTKSGSVAKAFEMIIQQACWETLRNDGYDDRRIMDWETRIATAGLPPGQLPPGIPPAYQQAVETGWLEGLNRIRRIAANARYFTDAAGKVPIDVGTGAAAVGIAIDFYGRFQAESTRAPDGTPRMVYMTPLGGSSVSADPISLLRGAPHRELALRFITFTLTEDGQKLWNYRPGTPGGPRRFALRRLPIRRDFYPSDDPVIQSNCLRHVAHTSDDLTDPTINPYHLAEAFQYQPRWTARHFGIQRDLVRALCMDSGEELRAAWGAILRNGGPQNNPEAMQRLLSMPQDPMPVTWLSAITDYPKADRLEYLRLWTSAMRRKYREARRRAEQPFDG